MGVEKNEVRELILQLQRNKQTIPLQCTHVITSNIISRVPANIVSTVSHADPKQFIRESAELPKNVWLSPLSPPPPQCITSQIRNSFSTEVSIVEQYPARIIGTLHSDLFLQAFASNPRAEENSLNRLDEHGNTALHRVLLEPSSDHELIGKRLYSMILAGGDLNIKNSSDKTVRDLVWDDTGIINDYIKEGLERLNFKDYSEEECLLNRVGIIEEDRKKIKSAAKLIDYILRGGNPYEKGVGGLNILDISDRLTWSSKFTQPVKQLFVTSSCSAFQTH